MAITAGDTVTVEYTGRLEDGTLFDTSRREDAEDAGLTEADPNRTFEPLSVDIGAGELIDGFEDALLGLEEGDSVTETIPPDDGYGEWEDDRVEEFDREEIDSLIGNRDIEEGDFLQTERGTMQEVLHVDDDHVRVDFNHRLAGETLEFDIEVVDVA